MSYYGDPSEGPTPEQEAAWDYQNLREYTDRFIELVRRMVEIGDPTMDVADGVSFYDAWCKEAEALLPKPSAPRQPLPLPDDGDPF